MRQEHINYFWVGIFVIAMILLLIATLYRVTGRHAETDTYYVKYTDISEVQEGSKVTYGGYQIGNVDEIIPQQEAGRTIYRLRLDIKAGWQIPQDSTARIVIPRLLSASIINIIEGASDRYLSPGDTIEGEPAITASSLIYSLNQELKPLIQNLDTRINTIGDALETHIPEIAVNLNRLIDRFNDSAERLSHFLSETNRRHVANLLENADTISADLKDVSSGFDGMESQLNELLQNSNELLATNNRDLRRTMVELRKSMETISRSINTIVYNLETTSRNMSEFSRQIRQNPGALLGGKPPRDRAAVPQ